MKTVIKSQNIALPDGLEFVHDSEPVNDAVMNDEVEYDEVPVN